MENGKRKKCSSGVAQGMMIFAPGLDLDFAAVVLVGAVAVTVAVVVDVVRCVASGIHLVSGSDWW